MIFAFDIDGTVIDTELKDGNYIVNKYDSDIIRIINKLYLEGHTIIIQTARHWDKLEETREQLRGIMYTTLVMGNVVADYYINDKALTPEDFTSEFHYAK